MVVVPKAGIVYVRGEVSRPGQVLNPAGRVTILQVVAVTVVRTCRAQGETRLVLRIENGFQEVFAGGRIKNRRVSKSALTARACIVLRQAIAALPPARLFGPDATLRVCFRYHSYVRAMPLSSGI